jgi:drug/metabolite transporter (DMT)-like permease
MTSNAAATIQQNLRGATMMTVGMLGFAVNDTITKSFAGELGVGQLILIRGIIATSLVYIVARYLGHTRPWRLAFRPMMFARSVSEIAATFFFLTALFHLPIANVSAIMQMLPLALTMAAAVFFGETIGWRRVTAILIGLAGVLIIIRPGLAGFNIYSVYVLGAVGACVVRDLVTRRLGAELPALFITFVTSVFVTAMGAVLSLTQPWQPVTLQHMSRISASALFLLIGYYFVVQAMRVGDIGFVSPFRYFILIFSIVGGMVAFHEFPDLLTWLGSALVVATGVYTLYRERVVRRQAITPVSVRT